MPKRSGSASRPGRYFDVDFRGECQHCSQLLPLEELPFGAFAFLAPALCALDAKPLLAVLLLGLRAPALWIREADFGDMEPADFPLLMAFSFLKTSLQVLRGPRMSSLFLSMGLSAWEKQAMGTSRW